jgi:hypothetical protein
MDVTCNAGAAAHRRPRSSASDLPFRATTAQACAWLARQTGDAWSLARLVAHGLRPSVWLDYADHATVHNGDGGAGFAMPIALHGDTSQLSASGTEIMVTITQGSHQIVTTLRFLKRDVERLACKLSRVDAPTRTKPPSAG